MSDKSQPQHQDYFGRDLARDDCVVFSVHNLFQVGRITSVTPKMVRVVGYDHARKNWSTGEVKGNLKYGHEVLKVDPQEVTMYLLKKPSHGK
jgi:hypothetical protein